jgi:hypothetical protein
VLGDAEVAPGRRLGQGGADGLALGLVVAVGHGHAWTSSSRALSRPSSPEQKQEVDEMRRQTARDLYAEADGGGRRKYSQAEIGADNCGGLGERRGSE